MLDEESDDAMETARREGEREAEEWLCVERKRRAAEPLKYVLRLNGFETLEEEGFSVYFVRVAVESGEEALDKSQKRLWYIRKRYSQFDLLRKEIVAVNGTAPELPEKRLFGNLNQNFIKARARGLSKFVWELAQRPALCALKCVHSFLWTDVCIPSTKSLLPVTPLFPEPRGSISFATFTLDDTIAASDAVETASSDIADLHGSLVLSSVEGLRRSFKNAGIMLPEDDLIERETTIAENEIATLNSRPLAKACANFMPSLYRWYSGSPKDASEEDGVSADLDLQRIHLSQAQEISHKRMAEDDELRRKLVPALRFVIILVGSRGDVQPYIALGQALRKRGHYVRVAAHEVFRHFVKSSGLNFAPLAGDPKELLKMVTEYNMFSFQFVREGLTTHRTWVAELLEDAWDACTLPESQLRQGPNEMRRPETPEPRNGWRDIGPGFAFKARKSNFRADAIIANPPSFAGWHLAEALGTPLYISFPMPWSRTTKFPSPFTTTKGKTSSNQLNWLSYGATERLIWLGIGDLINRWRVKTLRLPPIWTMSAKGHRITHDAKVPHLYPWSPQILPKPEDWAQHIAVTGYWFMEEDLSKIDVPKDLEKFLQADAEPPIFLGFGSVVTADPEKLCRIIVDALRVLSRKHRFVVQTGWASLDVGAEEDAFFMANVLQIGPVSHRWLFEKCKAIIHHGGAGTTAESIRAGVPQVVVPFFGDQFFWARQVKETKVGTKVQYTSLTTANLIEAVEIALQRGTCMRAKVLGRAVQHEKGQEVAIAFIERQFLRMESVPGTAIPRGNPMIEGIEGSNEAQWNAFNVRKDELWRDHPYVVHRFKA